MTRETTQMFERTPLANAVAETFKLDAPINAIVTKAHTSVMKILEGKLEVKGADIDALGAAQFLELASIFAEKQRHYNGRAREIVIGENTHPVQFAAGKEAANDESYAVEMTGT